MTTNEALYNKNLLSKKLSVGCDELSEDITELLKSKLIESVGNRCLKEGYVNKDTIKIVNRTIGKINPNHFNGEVYYNIQYEADVCYPKKDMVVSCKIKNINQLGIMAEEDCLTIVVAKQYMDKTIDIGKFMIGQKINVSILGSRFDLNDKFITIIGTLA